MTELTELAGKYARQRANIEDLARTVALAQSAMMSEQRALDVVAAQLTDQIGPNRPRMLIPISDARYVLVHTTNGSFGVYASIDIIQESK